MIKDIVVNLSGEQLQDFAVDYAISVAATLDAQITGIAFVFDAVIPDGVMGSIPVEMIEMQREENSKAAQTASHELNSQLLDAREAATKAGLKLLDVAKEDADAGFAAVRDFLSAKSPIEAFDIYAKYWRGRLETRLVQAQDLGAFVRKAADDAVRPLQ